MPVVTRAVLTAATLLAFATGCGADGAPSPAPTPSKPAVSSSPPVPVAADGTNLGACTDGTCEVRVDRPASIPLAGRFGVAQLRVEVIGPATVTFRMVDAPGGGTSFACDHPSCSMSVVGQSAAAPAMATGSAGLGARLTMNRIRVELAAVSDGYAILRLAPVP